jgi:hypothetical protein
MTDHARRRTDDSLDDNRDDWHVQDYVGNRAACLLNALFTTRAPSWQCGGQGFESP